MNKDTKNVLITFALIIGITISSSFVYTLTATAQQILMSKETQYQEQQKQSELIMQELIAKWSKENAIIQIATTSESTTPSESTIPVATQTKPLTPISTPKKEPTTNSPTAQQIADKAKADALAKQTADAIALQAQADALAKQVASELAAQKAAAAKTTTVRKSRTSAAS